MIHHLHSVQTVGYSHGLLFCFFIGWFRAYGTPLLWGKEGPGEFLSGTEKSNRESVATTAR